MNLKSGKVEEYRHLSQFGSLKEFNSHFEMWLVDLKRKFTKGELAGLKRLARFAAKIPGVSNAKIGTILKEINNEYHDNGISRSTFKRMIGKAKNLGMLQVLETERKNGSQSSNLYIFNRYTANEPPKAEKLNHLNKTIHLSETNDKKITKRQEETVETKQKAESIKENPELDHTFVSDRVPAPFVQLVKYFFPEAKVIEEYWQMVKIAAYRNNRENEREELLDTGIDAFRQLIRKLKLTRGVKNRLAYFYGILDRKFNQLFFEELYDDIELSDEMPALTLTANGELLAFDWLTP